MKRKGRDYDIDHEVEAKVAELNHYIEELDRRKKELEHVNMRFNEVSRLYHLQPDDSNKKEKDAIKKRLEELMIEFIKPTEHLRLALGPAVHSGAGGSSQSQGVEKHGDLESVDRDAELDHCLEELDARKKEMQDVTKKLKEIKREYHDQPVPAGIDALEQLHKRLNESRIELDKTTDQLRLAINKVKTEVKNLKKQDDT